MLKKYLLRMDLTRRLIILNAGLAIFGTVAFTLISYFIAQSNVSTGVSNSLRGSTLELARHTVDYFDDLKSDIVTLSSDPTTRNAMIRFRDEFALLGPGAKKTLQDLYIKNTTSYRKYKLGEKNKNIRADDSSYSQAHAFYQPFFNRYNEQKNYYDIFLVDMKGNIVYSVFKELDYATNLLNGEYAGSNIAEAYAAARKQKHPEDYVKIVDFKPYAPSYGEPAAFLASPIKSVGGETTLGVIVMQISVDDLNRIVELSSEIEDKDRNEIEGSQYSLEAYIVGSDGLQRTDNRLIRAKNENLKKGDKKATSILDSKAILKNEALSKIKGILKQNGKGKVKSGQAHFDNYEGKRVISSYLPLKLDAGLNWVLMVEIEEEDALALLDWLKLIWGLLGLSITVVVILITYFIARNLASPIKVAVNTLSTTSREIAATIDQQERTSNLQSTSVNQTTTTMAELGTSSRQTAEQAEAVQEGAQKTLELAGEGEGMVNNMLMEMSGVKTRVGAIAEQILHLSEQTNQIVNITNFVSDLANQTNMLALNAAVEAVRAGEHGKGFAVVASEIRKLADQSKKSAERIHAVITDIQKATDSTVMATDEGSKTVDSSLSIAQKTVSTFQGVAGSMERVFENTQQITLNVKQQAIAINEVVEAMNVINSGARDTAGGISQTKVGIHQLNDASTSLNVVVHGTGVGEVKIND